MLSSACQKLLNMGLCFLCGVVVTFSCGAFNADVSAVMASGVENCTESCYESATWRVSGVLLAFDTPTCVSNSAYGFGLSKRGPCSALHYQTKMYECDEGSCCGNTDPSMCEYLDRCFYIGMANVRGCDVGEYV